MLKVLKVLAFTFDFPFFCLYLNIFRPTAIFPRCVHCFTARARRDQTSVPNGRQCARRIQVNKPLFSIPLISLSENIRVDLEIYFFLTSEFFFPFFYSFKRFTYIHYRKLHNYTEIHNYKKKIHFYIAPVWAKLFIRKFSPTNY